MPLIFASIFFYFLSFSSSHFAFPSSFRIKIENQNNPSLINCRSSGLRVCTAAGSTAAMLSSGGFPMPILSRELQYMVREPISPRATDIPSLHGLIKPEGSMDITWYSKEGAVYVDGSHVVYPVNHGDEINLSTKAPTLRVFLRESFSR